MKKLIIEFIGTMFLVLVIGLSGNPLAIGSVLMVMVYMGGHISGGHYNPAVTLAVVMRGKMEMNEASRYWIAQILGGLFAGAVSMWLKGVGGGDGATNIAVGEGYGVIEALAVEIIFTFALASTVLNTATSKDTAGNSFYGLAIGFTVFAGAMSVGGISGGAFNPAVGIGHDVWAQNWSDIWIYIVGPLVGGAIAASVYKMTNDD
jgi:aquaporin Z